MYKIYVSEETYMRYIRRGVLYEIYGDEEGFGRGPAAACGRGEAESRRGDVYRNIGRRGVYIEI